MTFPDAATRAMVAVSDLEAKAAATQCLAPRSEPAAARSRAPVVTVGTLHSAKSLVRCAQRPGSSDRRAVPLLRAGALDAAQASLDVELIAAVDKVRPLDRPGLGETLFCCTEMPQVFVWAVSVRRMRSLEEIAIHRLWADPSRLWAYPVAIWDRIAATPNDRAALGSYWEAGVPIDQLDQHADDPLWDTYEGIEVLVPVTDIVAIDTLFEGI